MTGPVEKSDAEWRETLTPEQFAVCRCSDTEPAFTGQYWDCHDPGIYRCVCCGAALFNSEDKFDSGTGWPSFTRPAIAENVSSRIDNSHGMQRIEVLCKNCGAHLGHIFPDGPPPTHLRFCINSTALALDRN